MFFQIKKKFILYSSKCIHWLSYEIPILEINQNVDLIKYIMSKI